MVCRLEPLQFGAGNWRRVNKGAHGQLTTGQTNSVSLLILIIKRSLENRFFSLFNLSSLLVVAIAEKRNPVAELLPITKVFVCTRFTLTDKAPQSLGMTNLLASRS